MIVMTGDFLSCDWGTTSFRLRSVSGSDARMVREIRTSDGIKPLHAEAQRNSVLVDPAHVFGRFLHQQLGKLFEGKARSSSLPLVISGIASSSIGWRELPYAAAPFALDGRGLIAEELDWNKPAYVGPCARRAPRQPFRK